MNAHSDITIGNDIAKDIYCDITMNNNVAMCRYHGFTMHDIAWNLIYLALLCLIMILLCHQSTL